MTTAATAQILELEDRQFEALIRFYAELPDRMSVDDQHFIVTRITPDEYCRLDKIVSSGISLHDLEPVFRRLRLHFFIEFCSDEFIRLLMDRNAPEDPDFNVSRAELARLMKESPSFVALYEFEKRLPPELLKP
ncbi:MAG TPA: hypothetical protein VGF92_15680 [Stellaceae bacterium]|jgi:hypothetical protein